MTKINQQLILEKTTKLYAYSGLTKFSMRSLAKELKVAPSVIYHHFLDEDSLLKAMFDHNSKDLGLKRKLLPKEKTTSSLLKQRINFQIDNSAQVVSILKYYLAFRKKFSKKSSGFIPDRSSLHMEEVLLFAQQNGEYSFKNLKDDAKVMTHAVNGFLLEYYPYELTLIEKRKLVNRIFTFIYRSINGGKS